MAIEPVKAAIVGCGVISHVYIQSIREQFSILDITACCDLNEERMNDFAAQYGIRARPYEKILGDQSIGLVINLTVPKAHHEITKQALLAGKHVYSEKTLAITMEESLELCALAKERGLRLGTAPDTFLGGPLQTARYMVDHGLIGKPLSFVASISRDYGIFGQFLPHLRQTGGGLTLDCGCYYLTALASIFGPMESVAAFSARNEPDRVNCRVGHPSFGEAYTQEVENVVAATLRMKNGMVGTVHINSDSLLTETTQLQVFGTDGILDLGDPNLFEGSVTLRKAGGEPVVFPSTHGFQKQARGIGAAELAWALRSGRPHRASMEMGHHTLEVLLGILRSGEEGRFVKMQSAFALPEPLPAGYLDAGPWGPTPEAALI